MPKGYALNDLEIKDVNGRLTVDHTSRTCSRCRIKFLNVSEAFYTQLRIRRGMKVLDYSSYCKACQSEVVYERYKSLRGRFGILCTSIRGRQKRRWPNEKCDVTAEWLVGLFAAQDGKCALTGLLMTTALRKKNEYNETNVSIDRKDPTRGYTRDNLQLVCRFANTMKIDMSMEQFIERCKLIVGKHEGSEK